MFTIGKAETACCCLERRHTLAKFVEFVAAAFAAIAKTEESLGVVVRRRR